jgi:hypothetical protein
VAQLPLATPENITTVGRAAVFIGVLIAGEDDDENGCTIALRTASEARA